MADAAALIAAAESADPFALARLERPDDALVRFVDEGLGYEWICAIPRASENAILDGNTFIVGPRKVGAGTPAESSSSSPRGAPAPADSVHEPRPRA
jgi:hypothetical protein